MNKKIPNFKELLSGIERGKDAKEFEKKAKEILQRNGFLVQTQVFVNDRGDGRRGRIDMVASKDGWVAAIELDRLSARAKSIYKISHYPADYGCVLLRESMEIIDVQTSK